MNSLINSPVEHSLYSTIINELGQTLSMLSVKLGELLMQIKNGDSISPILVLMAISFAYGFVHAAGPGHGKTLVASYFTANDKSYKKAIFIALMIAIVHTFSAFLITLAVFYIFSAVFSFAVSSAANITTKISGGAIVGLGLYFLYNKIKHYKNLKKPQWSVISPVGCSCAGCKTKDSTELMLILSAGIIPCPGTITIFLFSITLGLFYIGLLSALSMSLGMGFVIALTAVISTKVRKATNSRFSRFLVLLDFGAVATIIVLGLILIIV
jgi:ABC-type nickel/cobalt efflux system permease component RcnA